jgi:hypothetical protein
MISAQPHSEKPQTWHLTHPSANSSCNPWRPGSALSLLWQQDQEADRPLGGVRPRHLWDALSTTGDGSFAVKISYWLPVR